MSIQVSGGERVLIPEHKAGWKAMMTREDLQAMVDMPPVLMRTILLALTEGRDGMLWGGSLRATDNHGNPLNGIVEIENLVAIHRGELIVYANAAANLSVDIAWNNTDEDQWLSVFARRTEMNENGKREFRDDTKLHRPAPYQNETPTDTMDEKTVRRTYGIDLRTVQQANLAQGYPGYLWLGYARIPPTATETAPRYAEKVTTTAWVPMTVGQHRGKRDSEYVDDAGNARHVLDHPDGSVELKHLSKALRQYVHPTTGEKQFYNPEVHGDETPRAISQELLAAAGDTASLSERIGDVFKDSEPGGIVDNQEDLVAHCKQIINETYRDNRSTSYPSCFELNSGYTPDLPVNDPNYSSYYSLTKGSVNRAVGGLCRVAVTASGILENEQWGGYYTPAGGKPGASGTVLPMPAGFSPSDWKKLVWGAAGPAEIKQVGVFQHNVGNLVCVVASGSLLVNCYYRAVRTRDAAGAPVAKVEEFTSGNFAYMVVGVDRSEV